MDWKKLSTIKIQEVYNGLFLNRCYLCNAKNNNTQSSSKSHNTLCQHCHQGFAKNTNSCYRCKRPTHTANILCGQCQVSSPPYQLCVAPYRFEGIVKALIHSIKFNQGNHYIRPLTYLLSEQLIHTYSAEPWPEQILYVPSHPTRIKERGFCQTHAMTQLLIKNLRLHLGEKCPLQTKHNPIKKIKHTQAQHSLTRKERLQKTQNSYQIDGEIAKHVALFDDVMTTGSTIESCTRLLLKAGAERVDVWVIARTPDKGY
ncbi:ComF family protein [Marinomonas sp. M1K-6]|uniref:ComF family protein n=1 Tax=Marinomonas profundi TaxID=2726122 RepID=A0A847QZT9_9GAMM|nr:ComF family protein [Marinomonas profundi]NLQ16522.1 ComF family protein [Marinomonas profundi]UDV03889.1 ComF family protein [Marinomonas profundi]